MQPALVLIFLEIFGEFHSYSTWYKVIEKCLRLYAKLDVSVRVTKCSSLPISPFIFPSPSVMSPPDVLILSINTSGTMSSPKSLQRWHNYQFSAKFFHFCTIWTSLSLSISLSNSPGGTIPALYI